MSLHEKNYNNVTFVTGIVSVYHFKENLMGNKMSKTNCDFCREEKVISFLNFSPATNFTNISPVSKQVSKKNLYFFKLLFDIFCKMIRFIFTVRRKTKQKAYILKEFILYPWNCGYMYYLILNHNYNLNHYFSIKTPTRTEHSIACSFDC